MAQKLPPGSTPESQGYIDSFGRALEGLRQGTTTLGRSSQQVGAGLNTNLFAAENQALPIGFSTLLDVLASQGKTDPRKMNQQISDIDRRTQNRQMAAQARGAAAGLTGSAGLAAIESAIAQGGDNTVARLQADEAAKAEERKRQDLALMAQILIDPALQQVATERGVSIARMQANSAAYAAKMNALGNVTGAILGGVLGSEKD